MATPHGISRAASTGHEEIPHIKSRPSVLDLLRELDSIVNWEVLLMHMGRQKYENDKTKANIPGDVDAQKMDAFEKWLKKTPDACWKNVIDALFQVKELALANKLEKKYDWKDPRVFVGQSYVSAPKYAQITAVPIGDIPYRRFLPTLKPGLDYYICQDRNVRSMDKKIATGTAAFLSRQMLGFRSPYRLANFFESIEHSASKGDFKVGLEARFGHVYWKLNPSELLPPRSTQHDWIKSKLLKKTAFTTEVKDYDVERLVTGRRLLYNGKVTRIKLNFIVEGQNSGTYSAIIATYDDEEMFCLDTVYRLPAVDKQVRFNVSMPGRKYDFRIADCTECALLAEHKNSIPYQMAQSITSSLRRLADRKLYVILRGTLPSSTNSVWKVEYIRQRVQEQYEWKPMRRWILAKYDVDVFDFKATNPAVTVDVSTVPLNEGMDLREFDISRKEVELWCQKIFPRNVDDSNPSIKKYYYMEGIEGVTLAGREVREPYDWTTKQLLEHFEEFVGDALKIAHILDGSPY